MSEFTDEILKEATGKSRLTFALILKAELEESDYNQVSLAKEIGVSRIQIQNYLKGAIPSAEVFRKICDVFGQSENVLKKYIIQDLVNRTNKKIKNYDSSIEIVASNQSI